MEDSILLTTKKILGLVEGYDVFDLDILMRINSALSVLGQLGIAIPDGYSINDETAVWSSLTLANDQLGLVKNYIFLKVRLEFDPPGTSFLIKAIQDQILEYEVRLNTMREVALVEEVTL